MNAGSRADHNQFCKNEKWELVRDARGGAVGHHLTYELALPDGVVLRTRISRPPNGNQYGTDLWKHILRDQLVVTEVEFWACVNDKTLPNRGRAGGELPVKALPAGLVNLLINAAGVPDEEAKGMTLEQANARMAEHWSKPLEKP